MQWDRGDGYFVSDDGNLVDVDRVHDWLSNESYWASGRPIEVVRRSIEQSITLGCYEPGGNQIGVCRWVTDCATFGWLCDVFVDNGQRGRGLGVFLVQSALAHPAVQGLRLLLLGTRDAQDLYSRFGFVTSTGNWMEKRSSHISTM
jgi:predicted GNAT family N-acyltransferase